MSEGSTADSHFTATECLDPGDWLCYREKILPLPDFIFCLNASDCNTFPRLESFHSNIRESLPRRVVANAKEAERYSDGDPGGSSCPAELCIYDLSPGGSWNKG